MLINANIYNHLSSSLVPKKRNTTHKSSELKAVYSNMARYNQKSPMYLFSLSEKKQSQIINIKEAALTLKEVADCFSDKSSDVYTKKMLFSEDEDAITGSFKQGDLSSLPDELHIQVNSLAKEQVNTGNYLISSKKDFAPGSYSFTMSAEKGASVFKISVSEKDTNIDVQQRIQQCINSKNAGVTASIINEGSSSALMFISDKTGHASGDDGLHFSFISDSNQEFVDSLGLNNLHEKPQDSTFSINGDFHTSSSNQISINQIIELDFHAATVSPVTIRFTPDADVSVSQIDMFIDAYNSLIDLADPEEKVNPGSRNLFNDISVIAKKHKTELEDAGLEFNDENKLVKDDELILQSVQSGRFSDLFGGLSTFREDLSSTTGRLTIDPVAYINKLIVTYPNTKQKYPTVYNKSLYSGLIYNNYA